MKTAMDYWKQFARLPVNRPVVLALWWNVGLALFALVAMPSDHRHILGLNPWVKPLKFDLSALIFLATLAVLLGLLPSVRILSGVIAWLVSLAMVVENSIISLQSLRGVRSHMNYTSAANGFLFGIMGIFIAVNTVAMAVLLVLWLRRTTLPPAVAWGFRLGLLAFIAGSLEGSLMVAHGGHTVGAPDGLPGLPFVNWSIAHGDLRIAHFFALHALQAMPFAGWLLAWRRLPPVTQIAGIFGFFVVYMAAIGALFLQAQAGHPLLHSLCSQLATPLATLIWV